MTTSTSHIYLGRPAGAYVHDDAPDSKLTESTFMINLPPSGGFVSSASYTIGKRENQSNMANGYREDPETKYQKLAADATYTPGENWTVNFRYRMLDLDNDSPATLTSNQLALQQYRQPHPRPGEHRYRAQQLHGRGVLPSDSPPDVQG